MLYNPLLPPGSGSCHCRSWRHDNVSNLIRALFTETSFSRLKNQAEDEMDDTRWTRLRLAYAHHRMLYMNTESSCNCRLKQQLHTLWNGQRRDAPSKPRPGTFLFAP
jgi:hypothetical protein